MKAARCVRCRALLAGCVCDVWDGIAPSALETQADFWVVLHGLELLKNTNTGWLAAQALHRGHLSMVERPPVEERGPLICDPPPPADALLLMPDAGRALRAADAGRTLLVLDGNWRQVRKLRARFPVLAEMDRARLPESALRDPSAYGLRTESSADRFGTMEAMARALAVVGDVAAARALSELHTALVARTLALRS